MGRLRAFFSSNRFLFICLGILGVLGAGAVAFAAAPGLSTSAHTAEQSSPASQAVSSTASSALQEQTDTEKKTIGTAKAGRSGVGGTADDYEADISIFLEEAYQDAASGWTGLEQEQARQQLLQEMMGQMSVLEQALLQIDTEKQNVYTARDNAVTELEKVINQADADLIQATVDLRIAEQSAPQKLAIGENPYIAINEAKTRQQNAATQKEEAKQAIEEIKQDCDASVLALDKQAATVAAQISELQKAMDAL